MGWSDWWIKRAAALIVSGYELRGSNKYPEVVRGSLRIAYARGLSAAWRYWQYECYKATGKQYPSAVREYVSNHM